jgi:hypothetical protein
MYHYPTPSGQISDRYPNPRVKLSSLLLGPRSPSRQVGWRTYLLKRYTRQEILAAVALIAQCYICLRLEHWAHLSGSSSLCIVSPLDYKMGGTCDAGGDLDPSYQQYNSKWCMVLRSSGTEYSKFLRVLLFILLYMLTSSPLLILGLGWMLSVTRLNFISDILQYDMDSIVHYYIIAIMDRNHGFRNHHKIN